MSFGKSTMTRRTVFVGRKSLLEISWKILSTTAQREIDHASTGLVWKAASQLLILLIRWYVRQVANILLWQVPGLNQKRVEILSCYGEPSCCESGATRCANTPWRHHNVPGTANIVTAASTQWPYNVVSLLVVPLTSLDLNGAQWYPRHHWFPLSNLFLVQLDRRYARRPQHYATGWVCKL